jgi:anti-sigma B factor antagonist
MCHEFHIEVSREDGEACVKPVGELDLATVRRLDARLEELRAEGVRQVVLDLRGLTFMDSTGLSLTVRWYEESRRDGFDLTLVQGEGAVRRLFELTGMEGRLPFVEPDG